MPANNQRLGFFCIPTYWKRLVINQSLRCATSAAEANVAASPAGQVYAGEWPLDRLVSNNNNYMSV